MYKRRQYTWSDGKSLRLFDRTLIMGILNGTPDSFPMEANIIHQKLQQNGLAK